MAASQRGSVWSVMSPIETKGGVSPAGLSVSSDHVMRSLLAARQVCSAGP